jgi:hypothetical protein
VTFPGKFTPRREAGTHDLNVVRDVKEAIEWDSLPAL